jgi:hypothetical protein
MSKTEKLNEEQVFKQEISDDELEAVSGGDADDEENKENCIYHLWRNIYRNGFPNCAATVEDESWCDKNDACYSQSIDYENMSKCTKAWK